jgi:hypothetical protein
MSGPEPGFQCDARQRQEKREFALFFFRARSFRFFSRFFFLRAFALFFLASRSQARKREKSASAQLCVGHVHICMMSHVGVPVWCLLKFLTQVSLVNLTIFAFVKI